MAVKEKSTNAAHWKIDGGSIPVDSAAISYEITVRGDRIGTAADKMGMDRFRLGRILKIGRASYISVRQLESYLRDYQPIPEIVAIAMPLTPDQKLAAMVAEMEPDEVRQLINAHLDAMIANKAKRSG